MNAIGNRRGKTRRFFRTTHWLAYSGVWLLFTWIVLINKFRDSSTTISPRILYVALTVALLLIATTAAIRSRRRTVSEHKPSSNQLRGLDFGATALMIISSFTLVLAQQTDFLPENIRNVALAGGGLGLGWVYSRWAEFYTLLNMRSMAVSLFTGSILWAVAQVAFELAPAIVRSIGVVAMPALALLVLRYAFKSSEEKATDFRPILVTNLRGFWKAWVSIVTVSLITAMLIGTLSHDEYNPIVWRRALTVLFFAITMWVILNPRHNVDFASVWRVAFFILAISLTILIINQNSSFVSLLLRSSWQLLVPITWLTVCDIARHTDLDTHIVLGLGLVSYSLPTAFGGCLYHWFSTIADPVTVCTLMLFSLFSVLCACLSTRDPDTLRIFDELRIQNLPFQEFTTIDNRCNQLGPRHNLTQRETEILKMLGKGRSRAYIAETLFITENTVKTHVGHIYSKLGVHSKRELQQLIDAD